MSDTIRFTLDGRAVEAAPGESIWQVAAREGVAIEHLCWRDAPGYRADGNCRACMVEVKGERVLAASCQRTPTEGMEVVTDSARARGARRMVVELLLADQPEVPHDASNHLAETARGLGLEASRFPAMEPDRVPLLDDSHVAMRVNLDACIACGLCVRACREVQVNDVIGMAGRGHGTFPVFDQADPMGQSTCVACGECVSVCPTGALLPATVTGDSADFDDATQSVCPFCGVGCQVSLKVRGGRIVRVDGADGPANENRLCVKGRFGFDYVTHPHRLTRPLIRRAGAPKGMGVDPADPSDTFREATWDEALEVAARGLTATRDTHGPDALAGFGSAKCTNEEAYLFQRLMRQGLGTNNVDHCTRLCHASSVA
ncbi:MAG TPA: 4Fe-4S dicluster domain-containing protein, partial [Aliiroseovarius sp.]|nr:4Fe-4S dicluster domain-containing protein [Aliiroseovarius sp.]